MRAFSPYWKSSKKPKKQRKYRYNAPMHLRGTLLHAHLSKELRTKYKTRSLRVRKGDTVVIMRGQFRKKSGVVTEVTMKKLRVFIEGLDVMKKDGSKARYPIQASKLMIKELNLEDKKRMKSLEGAQKNG